MRKTQLLVILLILSIAILQGCSSNREGFQRPPNDFRQFPGQDNLSEGERQKMFEERQ